MKDLTMERSPIGAVVRKADDVFTHLSRRTATNGSFNRLDWHCFLFLHEKKGATAFEIIQYLSFLDGEQAVRKVLDRYLQEGLFKNDQGVFSITAKGEQVFEELLPIQEEIKQRALKGVSESAYATTIDTLQQIVSNVTAYLPGSIEENQR